MSIVIKAFFEALSKTDYRVTPKIEEKFKDTAPQGFIMAAKNMNRDEIRIIAEDYLKRSEQNGEGLRKAEDRNTKPASAVPYPNGRYTPRTSSSLPCGDRE